MEAAAAADQPPAALLDRMLQAPAGPSRWLASILSAPPDTELSTPEAVSNSSSGDTCRQQQLQQQQQQHYHQHHQQAAATSAKSSSPPEQQEWSRRISAGLCPYCGGPAATEEQRDFHERVHAMDEPYRCQLCACRFAYASSLRLHLAMHGDRDLQYRLHCTRTRPNTQHHFASPPPPKKLHLSTFLAASAEQQQQQQQLLHTTLPSSMDCVAMATGTAATASMTAAPALTGIGGGLMGCGESALELQLQMQPPPSQQPQQHQHQLQLHRQQQQQQQHRCPHCGKSYVRLGNLRNHLQRFHPY